MKVDSLAHLIMCQNKEDNMFVSSPEECIDLTYREMDVYVQKVSEQLKQLGNKGGKRIGILMGNGISWVTAFESVLVSGNSVVPLNPKLTSIEIISMLDQVAVQFVIGEQKLLNRLYATDMKKWRCPVELFEMKGCGILSRVNLNASTNIQENEALLLFTSGSTGVPKAVVLTHQNLIEEVKYIIKGHHLTKQDIVLCVLPFFHINGLVITLLTSIYLGSHAIVPYGFGSVTYFWQWVEEYKVTWFSAVPVIISMLLLDINMDRKAISTLRFARSASSALPIAVLEKFEAAFGIPVIEGYGLSEAGSQIATNPLPPEKRKAGSVGKPVGNEIRVVDGNGITVPCNVVGEVIVRGANITTGYLDNKKANRESFKNGWFFTGDLGRFDAEGYLFLTGRKKDLINRAGEKISPREIDEVLYQIPGIEIAAVAGVPDPVVGEEVVGFVQLVDGVQLSVTDILDYCGQRIAPFKLPKQIIFLKDFPKGANGKIQRKKLVDMYKKEHNFI